MVSLMEQSDETTEDHHFPTEPAFIVPVNVRDTPEHGVNQQGVFAGSPIAFGTKFWVWTDRVKKIHHTQLEAHISKHFGNDDEEIKVFLRQGFVLPGQGNDKYFNSNPTDAGRFMNHSSSPNCGPDRTLRNVVEGEELTMNYGFHGDPEWYRDICRKYGEKTESEIARELQNQVR